MRKHFCNLQEEHENIEDNKLKQIKYDNKNLNLGLIMTSTITTAENTKPIKIIRSNLNEDYKHTPNKLMLNYENPSRKTITTTLECRVCQKTFSNKIKYLRHDWLHKKTNCVFHCSEYNCPDIFKSIHLLNIHKQTEHKIKISYKCDICSASVSTPWALKQHQQQMHFPIELYFCNECGKTFKQKTTLDRHMKRKKGVYDHRCDQCEFETVTKELLTSHKRNRHRKLFTFSCDECGKGFVERFKLNYHMKKHIKY